MNELKRIKNNLHDVTLQSLWLEEFYHAKDIGVTPCNSDYWIEEPLRVLYDGIYNDTGLLMEFTVGIASSDHYEDFEFYVEDYYGGSLVEHFTTFDKALKRFIQLTGIRNPYVYTDDENGNAIRIKYNIRPTATIRA